MANVLRSIARRSRNDCHHQDRSGEPQRPIFTIEPGIANLFSAKAAELEWLYISILYNGSGLRSSVIRLRRHLQPLAKGVLEAGAGFPFF